VTGAHDPLIERALTILNEGLRRDPDAMMKLVNARIDCNRDLAHHPALQVGVYQDSYKIGVLGVINGLLGYSKGGIGAEGDVDPATGRFLRIRRFVYSDTGIAFDA